MFEKKFFVMKNYVIIYLKYKSFVVYVSNKHVIFGVY